MAGSTTEVSQFENGIRSGNPLKIADKFGKSSERKHAVVWKLSSNVIAILSGIFLCNFIIGRQVRSTFNLGFLIIAIRVFLGRFYDKGWLYRFGVKDKRRADWYLQIIGPGLLALGSLYSILTEEIEWLSFYGQFVICATTFDISNVLEGFVSLWLFDL